MIDSHCHLNFKAFKNDYREVISRSFANGIKAIINVGSNYETSQRAIKIAQEYKNCYAAIGLHPIHVNDEEFDIQKYYSLIRANKRIVKAIGETGFDFFHQPVDEDLQKDPDAFKDRNSDRERRRKQTEVFLKHLDLAKEFDLPVILHCRGVLNNLIEPYQHLLEIIQDQLVSSQSVSQNYADNTQTNADSQRQSALAPLDMKLSNGVNQRQSALRGVIHCFSANWEIAQNFLDLGFYIGFTGIITFDNCSQNLLEVVSKTPLEKILIETDAPYLAPEPYRGQRCEPWYVKFTAQKIAEIKKISLEKVIQQTTQNTKELFKI